MLWLFELGKGQFHPAGWAALEMSLWGSALKAAVIDPDWVVRDSREEWKILRPIWPMKKHKDLCSNFPTRPNKYTKMRLDWRASQFNATNIAAKDMFFWDGIDEKIVFFILRWVFIFLAIKVQTPATPTQGRSAGAAIISFQLCQIGQILFYIYRYFHWWMSNPKLWK